MKGLRAFDIYIETTARAAARDRRMDAGQELHTLAESCPVFVCDDVAPVFRHTERNGRDYGATWYIECPPVAIPYQQFWIELSTDTFATGSQKQLYREHAVRLGLLCRYDMHDRRLGILHVQTQIANGQSHARAVGSTTLQLTEELIPGINQSGMPAMSHRIEPEASRVGFDQQHMNRDIAILLFVLALLSAKNVTRQEAMLPRAIRKRPGPYAGTATHKHYTLDIPGARTFRESIEGVGEGQHKRLHIVRGHFADYTEGGGLFGKLHGRYYIAPHVRGSAERGTVTKDYRVLAPA